MNQKTVFLILGFLAVFASVMALNAVEVSGNSNAVIKQDSLLNTFIAGGWVMIPLLICSLVGVGYFIER